jgi:ATPase subunit of ABC transporter with duplicated ATPase domains
VVGANGAGKTTLLQLILGNSVPSSGTILKTNTLEAITQNGTNWMINETLLSLLLRHTQMQTIDDLSNLLLMHKFPIAPG